MAGRLSRTRKRQFLHADPHCCWCGREVNADTATLEHILPLSKGGGHKIDNLALACVDCNQDRGNNVNWIPPNERASQAAE